MADVVTQMSGNDVLLSQMKAYFSAVQDNLEQKQKDSIQSMMLELETLNQKAQNTPSKTDLEKIAGQMNDISQKMTQISNDASKNQTVIDNWIASESKRSALKAEKESFKSTWDEDIVQGVKAPEFKNAYDSLAVGQKVKLKLRANKMDFIDMEEKTLPMTTANTLTGTGYITYNDRQGIVPAQKINMRDILSTARADNGSYVTYRETNTVQATAKQTEGNQKNVMQYTFQAVTATLAYLAGITTFTKQLVYNLSFMQTRLPAWLLRDFYKKENDYLFTQIASNSIGTYVGSGTVDAEELLNTILSQMKANFNASYAIVDFIQLGRLLTTKPNDYSIPGGFYMDQNGIVRVLGTPVVAASWAQSDHALVYDYDYYERVEGEALNVSFSFENQDNFEKNLVTARIECFEELNRLRDDASIYRDFGNS